MKKLIFAVLLMFGFYMNAQAQLIKAKEPIDEKYLAGAVPVENGKVVFTRTIDISKVSDKDSIFKSLPQWINSYCKQHEMVDRKMVSNDVAAKHLEVGLAQYIVFKNTAFVYDRSQIIFHLIFQQNGDKLEVSMTYIRYFYEEERNPIRMTSETTITDEAALNKKGTGFQKGVGKFRTKTIDLVDEIQKSLQAFVSK